MNTSIVTDYERGYAAALAEVRALREAASEMVLARDHYLDCRDDYDGCGKRLDDAHEALRAALLDAPAPECPCAGRCHHHAPPCSLSCLPIGWTYVGGFDAPAPSEPTYRERLARAIHESRITVAKHGEFTDRCICNSIAASIERGMAGMVPRPNPEKVIAEWTDAPAPSEPGRCTGDAKDLRHECAVWWLAGHLVGDDGTRWRAAHAPAPSEPVDTLDTAIAILEHLDVEDDDDKDLYEDTVVGLRALAARARLRGEQR